ncbi:hypothetical protein HDU76_005364 [Blyttiomyces sp. JEL0837]|nr:hypothetical protein HDU76_005364 [Blyttiomyces sp. JEL0837]
MILSTKKAASLFVLASLSLVTPPPAVSADVDIAATVNAVIANLPQCAQSCLLTLKGVTLPATLDEIKAICMDLDNSVKTYDSCVKSTCTGSNVTASTGIELLLQNGCATVLGTTPSSSGSSSSTSSSGPSPTSSTTSKNAGMNSFGAVDFSVLGMAVAGVVGLLTVL